MYFIASHPPHSHSEVTMKALAGLLLCCLMLPALAVAQVNNITQGTGPFATIQAAINDGATVAGDVIVVDAGTYIEQLTINKAVTIRGANAGINPNTGLRGPETIVDFTTIAGNIILAQINAPGKVVLDGIMFVDNNSAVTGQRSTISASTFHAHEIVNCIISRNTTGTLNTGAVAPRGIEISPGAAGSIIIDANRFLGKSAADLFTTDTWRSAIYSNGGGVATTITNNVFKFCRSAINADQFDAGMTVSGNTFDQNGTAISFGGPILPSGSHTIAGNSFLAAAASTHLNCSAVAASFVLDATGNTFEGVSPAAMTQADLFTLEFRMVHRFNTGRNGLILVKANHLFIIPATGGKKGSIQEGITAASAGWTVNVSDGTFNERLTIGKSLTLQGNGETTTILDGTGLVGNGSGIVIGNGITNVSIRDLTVRNYTGGGPNSFAGIYAIGQNDNLLVQNVTLKDNVGGSGFYANGPVNGLTLNNLDVSGHTNVAGAARGIVIWNGLKGNITIINSDVYNNNCCGIELQDGTASGVTIENNNIYNNGDNGIGVVGMQGPGENLIKGNTLTNNGRFGIEVKNPNGSGAATGPGRVVVDSNNVSRTLPIGAEVRDLVGIAAFRRGVLAGNVDIPVGVVIRNNTVSGYVQPSSSDGFGIVAEGMNHTVSGNTVSGCDVGIQRQAGHLPYPGDGDQNNLVDQYFGRGNSPVSCGITVTGNTFLSNGVDTRDVGAGDAGVVLNVNTAKTFCSIQSAIDDAQTLAGHVIQAPAGTYDEDVTVNKSLSVLGAGAATTTIRGVIGGGSSTVAIGASNVTVAGFTITRLGNNLADWNNAGLNLAGLSIQGQALTGATVRDNVISGNRNGLDINNTSGHTFRNNVITNNRTGLIFRNQTDNITFVENEVTGNWTLGLLFLDASGGTNVPVQTALNCTFSNNNISGNWYGQVVDRQTGGSLPAPGSNLKNFSGNWLGTITPVVSTSNSTEPGYADLIPVAFGGTSVPPGGQPDILGTASANIDFTPFLNSGTDTNVETTLGRGTFGFQGNFSNLWVTSAGAQTGATGRIQEGINLVSGSTVNITAGTFVENVTINKKLTLQGAGSGSNPASNTIIAPGTGIGIIVDASGTSAGDRLLVQHLRVSGATNGIDINAPNARHLTFNNIALVSNTTHGFNTNPPTLSPNFSDIVLTNCNASSNGGVGFRVASYVDIDGLSMTGCAFNNNTQGYNDAAANVVVNRPNVRNVSILNSTFNNNSLKGIYTEKMTDAILDDIDVSGSGTDVSSHSAGIDINLKYGSYQNIQILNSTITGCGINDPNGGGILVKARSTGSYAGNPATLNNVTMNNLTVTNNGVGTWGAGIRVGESNNSFVGIDAGPTNVVISNSTITGNTAHGVRNATAGPIVVATCNWWGDPSGPSGSGPGTGDAVSTGVLFNPWSGQSILANWDFEAGKTPWVFYTNGTGSYNTLPPGYNSANAALISIATVGNNMQLYQTGFTLEPNTQYRLSFAAYSSSGRDLGIHLSRHSSPYTEYGLNAVADLTTSWQEFSFTFTTTGFAATTSDTRLRLRFNGLATAGNIYYIDRVVLENLSGCTPVIVTPPSITTHPSNVAVTEGQLATFTVVATGTAPLTYQWRKNSAPIGGAPNSPSYSFNAALADNGALFDCVVSNAGGSVPSNTATLTVTPAAGGPNVVVNGSFESGTSPWTFYTNATGSFARVNAPPAASGTWSARVITNTIGNNMQLFQAGISLKANTVYRLTFSAYSSTGKDLSVFLNKHTTPFTLYGLNNFVCDLTTSWQTFTTDFTTSGFAGVVNDGRLRFWFSGFAVAGEQYFIDNVILQELAPGPPPQTFIEDVPLDYSLVQNYPNPFNPSTMISYAIPEPSEVSLKVYDLLGQEVATLANGMYNGGYYDVTWNAMNSNGMPVGTGVYLCRMIAKGESGKIYSEVMKMVLMR